MLTDEVITVRAIEQLPPWAPVSVLATFLHEEMRPYHDSLSDVTRGIHDAFRPAPYDGSITLARGGGVLAGALVHLRTGMRGYIPENLILFLAVRRERRGSGLGTRLVRTALGGIDGDVKLHVEPGNPALRLYQRLGFSAKYLDLRLSR